MCVCPCWQMFMRACPCQQNCSVCVCVFVGRMLMCVCVLVGRMLMCVPCPQNCNVCVCWQSVNEAFVSFLAVSLWAEC